MKKVFFGIFLVGMFLYADTVRDVIRNNDQNIENERRQEELEKRQRELENEDFNNKPEYTPETENIDNTNKFFIKTIEVEDEYNLLSEKELSKVTKKYKNRLLGAKDINKLLSDINNVYIEKGYVTTRVKLDETQNMKEGVIKVKVITGKVEGVQMNQNTFFDRAKIFTSVPRNEILRLSDIEQATDQFNRLSSNNVEIKIAPGNEVGGSVLQVENQQTRTYSVDISYNNYGDESTGRDRVKFELTKDNLLGINDSLYASYQRGNNKRPGRGDDEGSLKELEPGEIYDGKQPVEGETEVGMEKFNEDWSVNYSVPFRYWTFNMGYSHSYYISSVDAYNGVFDTSGKSTQFNTGVDRVLYRDRGSKLSGNLGLKLKANENYFEDITLVDRRLTIGSVGLNYSRGLFGGILGADISYDRGMPWFRAETDEGKGEYEPKGEFNRYNFNLSWYRPITVGKQRLIYRISGVSQYSPDILYGSEKLSIGDEYTVRGYKGNSVSGDSGFYIKNEISYNISIPKVGNISPYIGYDFGRVWNNKVEDEYKIGHLSGLALGIRYNGEIFSFDVAYTKPDNASEYVGKSDEEVYVTFGVNF